MSGVRITRDHASVAKQIKLCESTDDNLFTKALIDKMADTVCAGASFKLIGTENKVVDVEGFHEVLGKMKDMIIGTTIMAIDLEDEIIITSFPQSLYFGASMETH